MNIERDGEVFRVTLNGDACLRFGLPVFGEGLEPTVDVSGVGNGWQRVRLTWDVQEEIEQGELAVDFDVLLDADFWWGPHLAPRPGDAMAQHVFRSPALIAAEPTRRQPRVRRLDA